MSKASTIFSSEDLAAIAEAIRQAELTTSGEIRVVVRSRRSLWERRKTVSDLAVDEFHRLGMDATRDKTGVIIFILLSVQKFHIAADAGINECVEQIIWDQVAEKMSVDFRDGKFSGGVVKAVGAIARILSEHFPRKSDDTNELANDVVLR